MLIVIIVYTYIYIFVFLYTYIHMSNYTDYMSIYSYFLVVRNRLHLN